MNVPWVGLVIHVPKVIKLLMMISCNNLRIFFANVHIRNSNKKHFLALSNKIVGQCGPSDCWCVGYSDQGDLGWGKYSMECYDKDKCPRKDAGFDYWCSNRGNTFSVR